jgi:hypothetical protein
MRYSVVDDFAIDFSVAMFEGLWDKHMTMAQAVGWSVQRSAKVPPTAGAPALSAFTPALLGPGSAELRLGPPSARADVSVDTKMAGFPNEPIRFVGRVEAMTRANAAMARRSGKSGVLFYGMAGAGKSSCALELAYGQQANFWRCAWFACPPEDASGDELTKALANFSSKLELALEVAVAPGRLDRLSEVMEKRAVLVVLDNAESLLTEQGRWLDPAWGELLTL